MHTLLGMPDTLSNSNETSLTICTGDSNVVATEYKVVPLWARTVARARLTEQRQLPAICIAGADKCQLGRAAAAGVDSQVHRRMLPCHCYLAGLHLCMHTDIHQLEGQIMFYFGIATRE